MGRDLKKVVDKHRPVGGTLDEDEDDSEQEDGEGSDEVDEEGSGEESEEEIEDEDEDEDEYHPLRSANARSERLRKRRKMRSTSGKSDYDDESDDHEGETMVGAANVEDESPPTLEMTGDPSVCERLVQPFHGLLNGTVWESAVKAFRFDAAFLKNEAERKSLG